MISCPVRLSFTYHEGDILVSLLFAELTRHVPIIPTWNVLPLDTSLASYLHLLFSPPQWGLPAWHNVTSYWPTSSAFSTDSPIPGSTFPIALSIFKQAPSFIYIITFLMNLLALPLRNQVTQKNECWLFCSLLSIKHEEPWLAYSGSSRSIYNGMTCLIRQLIFDFYFLPTSTLYRSPPLLTPSLVDLTPGGSRNTVGSEQVGHLWGLGPKAEAGMRDTLTWSNQEQKEYKNECWITNWGSRTYFKSKRDVETCLETGNWANRAEDQNMRITLAGK